jgi:hypothetical protein
LEREPESNTVALRLEGAEQFDFFRQPDFLRDPFLAGSYAVYKKETFVGNGRMSEGTGKLCHIYRPEIVDAGGRRVWGELAVEGDTLRVTIPEGWLSNARYPVTVDPVIGTTTVGAQTHWEQDPGEPPVPLYNESRIAVNRFLVNEAVNGVCNAYFYVYSNAESDSAGYPVFYSDSGGKPYARRSAQENFIDLRVSGTKPAGWRTGTLRSNGVIPGGSYLWFGVSTEYYWYARFDYGLISYDGLNDGGLLPDIYPLDYITPNNFKMSMYFDYSPAQSYTRTLTQGITLIDVRKFSGVYKRVLAAEGGGLSRLDHAADYFRLKNDTGIAADTLGRFRVFYAAVVDTVKTVDLAGQCRNLARTVTAVAVAYVLGLRKSGSMRRLAVEAGAGDGAGRVKGYIRYAAMTVGAGDFISRLITRLRIIQQGVTAFDQAGRLGDYIRGLYTEAGTVAGTDHRAEYRRFTSDTVTTAALSLRHLIIFIRLATLGFVRDFVLRRFLKSKEDIVLKSRISREIEIDSKII